MRRLLLITTLGLLCLGLLSCSDDDPVSPGTFRVTVKVVELSGAPVGGIRVNTVNKTPYLQDYVAKRKASVRIDFSSLNDADARMAILDVEGTEIRALFENTIMAGTHSVMWNGLDDEGVHQASGFYSAYLVLKHPGTEAVVYENTMGMVMALLDSERAPTGFTDGTGTLVLTDKRLFPHLYDPPVISARDENSDFMGFLELTPTMVFTMGDTLNGGGMRFEREVTGPMTLEFVWDPDKNQTVEPGAMATAATDTTNPELVNNRLGLIYPVPFN